MTYNVAQWVRGSSPLTRGKPRLLEILLHGTRLIPAHAGKTRPEHPRTARTGAHPRSRGENSASALAFSRPHGSSPLTRGKRSVTVPVNITARLIPAHAGKTLFPPFRSATRAAHPRSRGENVQVTGAALDPKGSSPLTRGKQAVDWRGGSARGLIPAHAGKTRAPERQGPAGPAHPRSRGENRLSIGAGDRRAGSSPLTRGKRRPGGAPLRPCRLIPAHAGKTRCWSACHFPFGAHPRSRGENLDMAWSKSAADGSSPLTRGKQASWPARASHWRLIPAHAGKTTLNGAFCYAPQAHPRSRGENGVSPPVRSSPIGSSPLTRGKPQQAALAVHALRLIPAHAGKTGMAGTRRWRTTAHPRSRGENLEDNWEVLEADGSSPLTRGKLLPSAPPWLRSRLIPAHAGKTNCQSGESRRHRAHPRSRGENCRRLSPPVRRRGSSPLTRGKPSRRYPKTR